MANKSSSKARKRREDKLDWESLESAPNVEGMLSYLRTPPVVPFPAREHEALPSDSLPSETVPSPEISPSAHNTLPSEALGSEPVPSVSLPSVSEIRAAATAPVNVPGVGRRRFHRCVYVQDAHTPGEQAVLNTLYRLGKNSRWGEALQDGSYRVRVSLAELARHVSMHETNVRTNLRSLTQKLAIEVIRQEDRQQQSAREYKVYTFRQILERRRSAGLEWVVKNRGVHFISEQAVHESLASEALPSDLLSETESLGSEARESLASGTLESLPSETLSLPYIGNNLGNTARKKETTSAVDPQLIALIRAYGHEPDDEILNRLTTACHAAAKQGTDAPVTVDEILYFTEQKLKVISAMPNVHSPLALLASIVPKCFEGDSFRNYRETQRMRQREEQSRLDAEQRKLEEFLNEQRTILDDPARSEDDKVLARRFLGLNWE